MLLILCRLGRNGAHSVSRPKSIPTKEGVIVVSRTGAVREHFQLFDIPSTEDDVLGFEGSDEESNDFGDILPPLFLATFFQATEADIIFVSSLFIREMTQLHGFDDPIDNHRRSKSRAEAEKE